MASSSDGAPNGRTQWPSNGRHSHVLDAADGGERVEGSQVTTRVDAALGVIPDVCTCRRPVAVCKCQGSFSMEPVLQVHKRLLQ